MSVDLSLASLDPVLERRVRPAERVACFAIHAEAAPGVMPRVLELFAKRNLVPDRWHSDRVGPDGRELAIDLQVQGLSADLTDYIARCLRQLHDVQTVLTSEKSLA
jgi:acetolactate synthase small subunit